VAISEPQFRFSAAIVQGAPQNSGVYALWQDGEMIYIGRAASIRTRLAEHLQHSLSPCLRGATHYTWELSLRPVEREAELLEHFRKRYGRLPRCNEAG
jgi:excinuclease UvrABC nuclease subunit